MLALLLERGVDVVVRKYQSRRTDFHAGQRLGKQDHLVVWRRPQRPAWMDKKTYATIPATLVVRELKVRVAIRGFRVEQLVVVTTLADAKRYPKNEIACLFRQRWHAEVFYRSFEQTFGRRKLRSHAPKYAEVELDWSLAGLWAVCWFAKKHHAEWGLFPSDLRVAGALRAIRRPMREYKSRPDPGEDLWTLPAKAVLDDYPRQSKRSRDYPKRKQEKPAGKPQIVNATKAHLQQAQELKQSEPQLRLTA